MRKQLCELDVLIHLRDVDFLLLFLLFPLANKMMFTVGTNKRFCFDSCRCKARLIKFIALVHEFEAKLRLLS